MFLTFVTHFLIDPLCACLYRSNTSETHLTARGYSGSGPLWLHLAGNRTTLALQSQRAETEGKGLIKSIRSRKHCMK